ncbi:MAG: phosphatase PAP2 family protein, partial [Balneolaceae bacterium]|nr:phosphatase PAP2 family protein [Balneolaceae bacterium]
LMITLDYPVHEQFHDRESYAATDGINTLTAPGRLYDVVDPHLFILGSSALMMGSGALFQNSKLTDTGFTALEAVFFSAMTTNFLKLVAGRGRPLYNGSNDSFDPMSFEAGNLERSFPSGHTTKAFAFATVIASSYDTPWVKIPSYALAGSVALQRIESGSHWISDVFAGAAIGYFVGKSLAQRNGLTDKPAKLTPIVKGGQLGLNVRF